MYCSDHMKNYAPNMKIIIPLMTLFLASCGVHNHRYDSGQDVYYEEDYYAYDNYDPYYGYGSSDYSTAGDGVYYNNYNYYPDRWGVTYSNVNYSPYRYPRVGFYFSSGYNCGYSYWSTRCSPSYFGSGYNHYVSSWWPSYGFGLGYGGYGGYFASNYWWYNHWRNRNYYHQRPSARGYYSARNEAGRLINRRYYSNSKNNQPRRNSTGNHSSRNAVYRGRSTGNRSANRTSGNRAINRSAGSRSNRNSRPVQRGRQEAAIRSNDSNYRQSNGEINSSRQAVTSQLNSGRLQNNSRENHVPRKIPNNNGNRYQKPALVASNISSQRVRQTNQVRRNARATHYSQRPSSVNVKPVSSQAPVYHNNRSSVSRQSTPQRNSQSTRSNVQRSNVPRGNQSSNRVSQARVQSKPKQSNQSSRSSSNSKPKSSKQSSKKQSRSSRPAANRSSSRQRQ